MSRPRVVDLFCGAGGFALGFHAAGCIIAAGVDMDEQAGTTFERNFAILQPDGVPVVLKGEDADLAHLDPRDVLPDPPDILIGGPPCQSFSTLGRAKLDSLTDEGFEGDPRNELYLAFMRATRMWRPKAVVMENVPGMMNVGGRNVAEDAAAELAREGYDVGYAVLNAVWYSVPQFRDRLFIIGIRNDLMTRPVMPAASHRAQAPPGYFRPESAFQTTLPFVHHRRLFVDVEHAALEANVVHDALGDLPELDDHRKRVTDGPQPRPRSDFRRWLHYRSAPHSRYARLMRSWPGFPVVDGIDDHAIRRTPRDYETFRRMRPGDRYPDALAIANARLDETIAALRATGAKVPEPGTPEHEDLKDSIVPPYPDHIFVDKWRKLVPDQPCWTVPAHLGKDAYSHIHYDDEQARSISVREAARLQSFPDGFQFAGNLGDCFRQIGNAVPPLLSWAIGHSLLSALGYEATQPPDV